jgi:hypothetical protein
VPGNNGISSQTLTTRLPRSTITRTERDILTSTVHLFTRTRVTVTSPAPCSRGPFNPAPFRPQKERREAKPAGEVERRSVERRINNPVGLYGDGPLTVTLTPLLVLTTSTGLGPTITITQTVNAPDATITVYVIFLLTHKFWSQA